MACMVRLMYFFSSRLTCTSKRRHISHNCIILVLARSTPIECLHTILLGAYKYLFKDLMQKATVKTKKTIAAKITAFPTSGRTSSLSGGITRYYQSCVGRDFKALAEMAPFILWEHLTCTERKIWLLLSEVYLNG